MQIKNNILTQEELKIVQDILRQEYWGFGYISNDMNKPIWNFSKEHGRKAAEIIASKYDGELVDYHINGQTIHQHAALHNDSFNGVTKAVIYFPFEWSFEWGGRLNIFTKNGEATIITPQQNLGVLFDASLMHYAEGPLVNKLRISIGLKLK